MSPCLAVNRAGEVGCVQPAGRQAEAKGRVAPLGWKTQASRGPESPKDLGKTSKFLNWEEKLIIYIYI